jgi:hypothetical protein
LHFERELARGRQLAKPICGRQAGDSAADYRNPFDL